MQPCSSSLHSLRPDASDGRVSYKGPIGRLRQSTRVGYFHHGPRIEMMPPRQLGIHHVCVCVSLTHSLKFARGMCVSLKTGNPQEMVGFRLVSLKTHPRKALLSARWSVRLGCPGFNHSCRCTLKACPVCTGKSRVSKRLVLQLLAPGQTVA